MERKHDGCDECKDCTDPADKQGAELWTGYEGQDDMQPCVDNNETKRHEWTDNMYHQHGPLVFVESHLQAQSNNRL